MNRVVIFGAGSTGREIARNIIKKGEDIVFFIDNYYERYMEGGGIELIVDKQEYLIPVKSPISLVEEEFDRVVLASLSGEDQMQSVLKDLKIDLYKIDRSYIEAKLLPRIDFLKRFSQQKISNNDICVAEVGVFQGDFAKKINQYFPHNKLYLFDTFEGFDIRDFQGDNDKTILETFGVGHLGNTSVDLVIKKMPYPNNVEIRKGYFPQTAIGLENKRFLFVNLDPDLYEPVLSGLKFFYPRLVDGGVILVHDYYNENYEGVKKAVDQFCLENNLYFLPIGDDVSIAIQKQ